MHWFNRIVLECSVMPLILTLTAGSVAWYFAFHDGEINWDLDPATVAASETRMWQCYYAGKGPQIGLEMMGLMREVYGASLKSSYEVVTPMLKGTLLFQMTRNGKYKKRVLPHLERAYTKLGQSCGREWDAHAAAQAELAWWVARRTPGKNSVEEVGELIAQLYGVLYGSRNKEIDRAAFLRAKAAKLRDQGGKKADWKRIEGILLESYTTLKAGLKECQ